MIFIPALTPAGLWYLIIRFSMQKKTVRTFEILIYVIIIGVILFLIAQL